MWNSSRPDEEMKESVDNIELRGYNTETYLTGEFANKLANGEIKPLSVSNIADKYCPTRRDLYIVKGKNKPKIKGEKQWGQIAGNIADEYISSFFTNNKNKANPRNYKRMRENALRQHNTFISTNNKHISKLRASEQKSYDINSGDTDWFLKLLNNNGKSELGMKILHSLLKENGSLDTTKVKINEEEIRPNKLKIGISSPATPDFMIPEFGIVGDIKTGLEFKSHFLLTCAGYTLAYENEKGQNYNIDWGIIYFLPSRLRFGYVQPLTFAQVYFFPINEKLREAFLSIRDEAYRIISNVEHPMFPKENEREHCKSCKFKSYCISQGLDLENYE